VSSACSGLCQVLDTLRCSVAALFTITGDAATLRIFGPAVVLLREQSRPAPAPAGPGKRRPAGSLTDAQELRLGTAVFGDCLLRGNGFDALFRSLLGFSLAWVGSTPQRGTPHRPGSCIAWCCFDDDRLLAPARPSEWRSERSRCTVNWRRLKGVARVFADSDSGPMRLCSARPA
jgi:hypothetical protein